MTDHQPSSARVLLIGDLHIGRHPTRIKEHHLTQAQLTADETTPACAWLNLVEHALREQVDAVVLLGDVVDESNQVFSALGPLSQGARQLEQAGIPLRAIAGNHDADVLPRLAQQVPWLELIGANGSWQDDVLTGPSGRSVRLVGWSFPTARYPHSPLDAFPESLRHSRWSTQALDALPVLGLLHGDLDQSQSPYAPIRSHDLALIQSIDAWALGHIHLPSKLDTVPTPKIGYLGSVVGLDPGESGRHGAWMAHCNHGAVTFEHIAVARHRYEGVDVILEEGASVDLAIAQAIKEQHKKISRELSSERLVLARMTIRGSVADKDAIDDELLQSAASDLAIKHDGVVWVLERKPLDRTSRAIDVASLAQGSDITAPLARILTSVDQDTITDGLRHQTRNHLLNVVLKQRTFRQHEAAIGSLTELLDDDEKVDELLIRAAAQALTAMQESRS